ncbi:transcription factor TRY-like isoform X2 [Alnus glutinosa]|uniref:transcription factor TRY-like isoform X2 n=1 Tax=Alnus glutinosa TaxID=3517 RepID=UPI002D767574|nr:transcription factor TRY-like isoform X2 [Alnus glutinosa]
MDKRRARKQAKTRSAKSEEVSSLEWEFIKMTEQEEDLIYRMYRLVGDRSDSRAKTRRNREVLDNETWSGICREKKRA